MNTYQIKDIVATPNAEGQMVSLYFTLLALTPEGVPAETSRRENFNPVGDMVSSFTPEAMVKLCEAIALSTGMYSFVDQVLVRLSTPASVVLPPLAPPETIGTSEGQYRAIWAGQIDNAVAAIYSRFTRFQIEYSEKESAAKAYVLAEYTGEPGDWVKDYATNAGLTYKEAADAILAEATKWREALPQLGALRVQKYRILNAESLTVAQEELDRIQAAIQGISGSL